MLPDSHLDLLEGRHPAVVTTIGPGGRPQSTVVYYLFENGALQLSIRGAGQKRRNLSARPACTFCVIDPANPLRYLEVRADAELAPDPDYGVRDRVIAHYGLPPSTEPPDTERVVVTLRPVRVRAEARGPVTRS